jgi:fructan beta-fructosidase
MAVVLATDRVVRLYRSDDLKAWAHLSDFRSADGGHDPWECPDLFELPVDGDPARTRWVLVVSVGPGSPDGWTGTQYFVGHFDGTRFTPDDPDADATPLDFGADYYAAVSFADTPDNERILIGWMSNWTYAADLPADEFRGSMSVPRVHRLARVGGRIRLLQEPVSALEGLRGASYDVRDLTLVEGVTPLPADVAGDAHEIRAVFRAGSAHRVGLHVRVGDGERTVVAYDTRSGSSASTAPSRARWTSTLPFPRLTTPRCRSTTGESSSPSWSTEPPSRSSVAGASA